MVAAAAGRMALVICCVVVGLVGAFKLYRTQDMLEEARALNRATVLEHQQRQADIAALTALNARLQSRDAVQHLVGPRVLAQWQSLSGAITAVQSVQLTRARFESGQWRLELQAPTRTDIQPLLQHWQALGLTIQLGAALDGVQGVTLPVLLEVATK